MQSNNKKKRRILFPAFKSFFPHSVYVRGHLGPDLEITNSRAPRGQQLDNSFCYEARRAPPSIYEWIKRKFSKEIIQHLGTSVFAQLLTKHYMFLLLRAGCLHICDINAQTHTHKNQSKLHSLQSYQSSWFCYWWRSPLHTYNGSYRGGWNTCGYILLDIQDLNTRRCLHGKHTHNNIHQPPD